MFPNLITFLFLITTTICYAAQDDSSTTIQQITSPILKDMSRSEINMAILWREQPIFIDGKRQLQIQILKPKEEGTYPVIIFSGGWSVNFRHYSQILKPLAARGYIIVNIDHYYQKDTEKHSQEFDEEVTRIKAELQGQDSKTKKERFSRTKVRALAIYYYDTIFILQNLLKTLEKTPQADLSRIALMGHSLGGNTAKRVIDNLATLPVSTGIKTAIKACVALDSRLNQMNASPIFSKPTLLLGAEEEYKVSDSLQGLYNQPNLQFILLPRAGHISFVDYVIYPLLGMRIQPLMQGLNSSAVEQTEKMISKVRTNPKSFFNGNTQELSKFLGQTVDHIDQFLKLHLSTASTS